MALGAWTPIPVASVPGGALTSTAYFDMTPVWAYADTYSLQPTTAGGHEGVSVTAMWVDIGG